MSRSAVPSQSQVAKLLDCLEKRRWLATGHARTSHARDRIRAAWQDVAIKLNSDGSGSIKNWQQWAKYWKDKKAAVKKKASQMRMARQRTGGGAAEDILLSAIEERIMMVMGGESFAIGDRELEINPFNPPSNNKPEPVLNILSDMAPIVPDTVLIIPVIAEDVNITAGSESILQAHAQSLPVERGTAALFQTEQSTPSIPDVQPGPSHRNITHIENPPNIEQMGEAPSPPPPAAAPSWINAPIATSSPRRRRLLTTRRRVIQRSPPSQRQSQMRSMTERFIGIEESRVETERILAQNQRALINTVQEMSEAWSRQSKALQDLVEAILKK